MRFKSSLAAFPKAPRCRILFTLPPKGGGKEVKTDSAATKKYIELSLRMREYNIVEYRNSATRIKKIDK